MSSHFVFVLQNQSAQQTLFLYNIHFITFYRIKLVSIKKMSLCVPPRQDGADVFRQSRARIQIGWTAAGIV